MINKFEKNLRKYRPAKISESIEDINKNIAKKINKHEYIIYSKWHEIVGDYFINYSEPEKLNIINNNESNSYEGVLRVKIANPAALEFQHFTNKIIEKINSYIGFKAVTRIILIQVSHISKSPNFISSVSKIESKKLSREDEIFIQKKTSRISSNNLKKALLNLGKSVLKNIQ